jgi:polyphosphate kinase
MAHHSKSEDTPDRKGKRAARQPTTLPVMLETDEPQGSWLDASFYDKELARLQYELVKMQYWIREKGVRVVIIFEGRDAAGKGGLIQRMVAPLNPRGVRLVALGKPSDVELTQWYFQRYVAHLPAAGEMVIFDRSCYNRAGVERVMGFCTDEQYWDFLASCPSFERMLVGYQIAQILAVRQ